MQQYIQDEVLGIFLLLWQFISEDKTNSELAEVAINVNTINQSVLFFNMG